MACCGKGAPKAQPKFPTPAPLPKVAITSPVQKTIPQPQPPPGSFNPPGRFCSKCGWIVAVSKYADPTTGTLLERRSCTNRKCIDYK